MIDETKPEDESPETSNKLNISTECTNQFLFINPSL